MGSAGGDPAAAYAQFMSMIQPKPPVPMAGQGGTGLPTSTPGGEMGGPEYSHYESHWLAECSRCGSGWRECDGQRCFWHTEQWVKSEALSWIMIEKGYPPRYEYDWHGGGKAPRDRFGCRDSVPRFRKLYLTELGWGEAPCGAGCGNLRAREVQHPDAPNGLRD